MKCRRDCIRQTALASNSLIYSFSNYFPPDE